tara:strand:+ start:813 stop:956 length:144 start_codon:yes stop_codon:yes gene_type:complete
MRVKITLWVNGTTWEETVVVSTHKDADEVALARFPQAKIVKRQVLGN